MTMNQPYGRPRPHVPADVERQVKVEAGHRCAVTHCQDAFFQIHHIDGNRENNDPANLIPLCGTHHARAHQAKGQTRISPEDLRLYKKGLVSAPSQFPTQAFLPAEEARRVAAFASTIRETLSWHDGESIRFIDDQFGYWFPVQVYQKLRALLEDRWSYEVDARSFDPEAIAHQDAIMQTLQVMFNEVSGYDYVQIGYFFSYRPGDKGSPGCDQRIERQIARFSELATELVGRLRSLNAYSSRRPVGFASGLWGDSRSL
jgi:hypothetical protein